MRGVKVQFYSVVYKELISTEGRIVQYVLTDVETHVCVGCGNRATLIDYLGFVCDIDHNADRGTHRTSSLRCARGMRQSACYAA